MTDLQPEDVAVPRVTEHKLTATIELRVPREVLPVWRAGARASGLTLNQYIGLSLALANSLRLVEGYIRQPGAFTLDPHLAEAIRQAAEGQPWEHRATLLLSGAKPGHDAQTIAARRVQEYVNLSEVPEGVNELFETYGSPNPYVVRHKPVLEIDGVPLIWREAALVLHIWDVRREGWYQTSNRRLELALGKRAPDRAAKALRSLIDRGLVEVGNPRDVDEANSVRLSVRMVRALEDLNYGWL